MYVFLMCWLLQAEYVELKLREGAILNLSQGHDQLVALDPALARAWGDGAQLPAVQNRIGQIEVQLGLAPGAGLPPDAQGAAIERMRKTHMER
jgi:hypothetical protein